MKNVHLVIITSLCFILLATLFFGYAVQAQTTYYTSVSASPSGRWDNSATWSLTCGGTGGAGVPGVSDIAIVCGGLSVEVKFNASCAQLIVTGSGSTLFWTGNKTLTVGSSGLTMEGGSIGSGSTQTGVLTINGPVNVTTGTNNIGRCDFTANGTTTVTGATTSLNLNNATGTKIFSSLLVLSSATFSNSVNIPLTINGDLQNDATTTPGTGLITFGGASSNTITGTQTTAFTSMAVNKGTSSANVLDVQSVITLTNGGLTLTNGTLKLSNASITITPFTADITGAPYLIPSTAALWCNGATISSGNMNWTVAGLLRVSSGTVTIGNTTNNNFIAENSGTTQLTVDGGTLNVAGAISRGAAADFITVTLSSGTLVVSAVGLNTAGVSPIQIDQASSTFTWNGGTLIIRQPGATNLGFTATAGTVNVSGGTLQIGDGGTPASSIINVNSAYSIANLTVNSANATARLATNSLTVLQAINISSGELNANALNITLGGTWTNTGVWTPSTGTVTLNGTGTQTITKSGGETFNSVTLSKSSGNMVMANNVQVNSTLTMSSGSIDCGSSTLTLGTSGASPGTLTYTAGTIIGIFKRWKSAAAETIDFPIGTASNSRLVSINFTAAPAAGTLTTNFVASDPGITGLPLVDGARTVTNQFNDGYWNFTAADGLSGGTYNISLTGTGFINYTIGPSTRLIYRTGASWTMNGTHSDAVGSVANRTGITGIATSQFGFGKTACSAYAAASITGATGPCVSTSEVYSVNASDPANTYTWSLPLGGGAFAPATGTSTTVTWGATGGSYTVRVTEANDCGDNNTPVDLSITLHGVPTSSITGSADVGTSESAVYSVTLNTGYSYSWTLPSGGGSITPPASGVDVNSVTVVWGTTPGTNSVRVDVTPSPCGSPDFQTLSVTIRAPFYSRITGSWGTNTTWSSTPCGGAQAADKPAAPISTDEVVICSGHTVTMNGNPGACRKLTITGTASWSQARTTNVGTGGIIINSTGDIAGTVSGVLTTAGGLTLNSGPSLSSNNVILRLQTNPQTIETTVSAATLKLTDITTSVTNNGTITIASAGALTGAGTLTQGTGAALTLNSTTFTLTTLAASASTNTVTYGASADQTIRSITYDDLVLSGTGTKNLGGGAVAVNDDLSITGVTLDATTNNYPITVSGDWTNTGTFTSRFGTVTFNGGAAQIITKTGGETFYNLLFSGAGTKTLANAVTVNFDFTNSSTFDVASNNIDIKGNFDNSGSISNTNSITFSNSTTISGPSTTTLNNVIITGTLTGHLTNFNVAGNWTNNGTFTHNSGKVTFSSSTTIGGSAVTTFNSVDITGTLTSSSGNVNIAKNFNNLGTFNHNSGTLTFNGSSAQTIDGANTFNNLTISNSLGGVAVASGAQNLIGTLTLSSGSFNTNNNFTLVSNGSGTARIAEITGGSITGDINMQRHIATASNSWRQLGTAVSGQTASTWCDDFPTEFGPTFYSIQYYDEGVAGDKNQGWQKATSCAQAIAVGQGFMCYVGNLGANIDIDNPGATNTGSIGLPVTYYNDPVQPASEDGWNLVANPYPCEIDWSNGAAWVKINVNTTIYIWNPATSNYEWWFGPGVGESSSGGSPYIPSSQSFWVQTSGAPTLTVTEAAKTNTNPAFFRLSGVQNILSQGAQSNILNLKIVSSNGYYDEAIIRFIDSATTNYNANEDALKLFSGSDIPYLSSSTSDSLNMALNSLPVLISDVTVPVRAGGKATNSIGGGLYTCNKTFTISAVQLDAITMSSCIFLEDIKTGIFTDLRDTSYTFTVIDTSNSPTYPRFVPSLDSTPRFKIHVGAGIEKSSVNESCSGANNGIAIAKGKGTGPFNYTWKDAGNSVVKVTSGTPTADSLKNVSAGTYTVEIAGNNGLCSVLKDTVTINATPSAINIISDVTGVSCFGDNDGAINLFVSGDNAPFTYLWSNNAVTPSVSGLPSSVYSVTITDALNCAATDSIFVNQPEAVTASFNASDTIYLSDGGNAVFENNSTGSDYYVWGFGDGSAPDSSFNPTHTYSQVGTYTVTLSVSTETCGNDDSTAQITVLQTNPGIGISEEEVFSPEVQTLQNSHGTTVMINFKKPTKAKVTLYDILGQKIYSYQVTNLKTQIPINQPAGMYFLNISTERNSSDYKIEVRN